MKKVFSFVTMFALFSVSLMFGAIQSPKIVYADSWSPTVPTGLNIFVTTGPYFNFTWDASNFDPASQNFDSTNSYQITISIYDSAGSLISGMPMTLTYSTGEAGFNNRGMSYANSSVVVVGSKATAKIRACNRNHAQDGYCSDWSPLVEHEFSTITPIGPTLPLVPAIPPKPEDPTDSDSQYGDTPSIQSTEEHKIEKMASGTSNTIGFSILTLLSFVRITFTARRLMSNK